MFMPNATSAGAQPRNRAASCLAPARISSTARPVAYGAPRFADASRSAFAIASPTSSGTCVPPGRRRTRTPSGATRSARGPRRRRRRPPSSDHAALAQLGDLGSGVSGFEEHARQYRGRAAAPPRRARCARRPRRPGGARPAGRRAPGAGRLRLRVREHLRRVVHAARPGRSRPRSARATARACRPRAARRQGRAARGGSARARRSSRRADRRSAARARPRSQKDANARSFADGEHQLAVGGSEGLVRGDRGEGGAVPARDGARGRVAGEVVAHQRDGGRVERELDRRAGAVGVALPERGEDRRAPSTRRSSGRRATRRRARGRGRPRP